MPRRLETCQEFAAILGNTKKDDAPEERHERMDISGSFQWKTKNDCCNLF
jgi:hypothetical protein